uniref:DNA ligase IV n=1 Tax=Vitrella brassicaformis TaxID=1169539 RepID=A0A7S1JWH8_9ALVE|mmetsp:Transcript_26905/g.67002  ORF Transcript_26905/g.67002 Transcript_26905/m.67002 type:complete len:891 (+) Transcript_26905:204-2876(+)
MRAMPAAAAAAAVAAGGGGGADKDKGKTKLPRITKEQALRQITHSASAAEQKWIARIILKDLKCGIKHETVIKRLSPEAEEEYKNTSSLKVVLDLIRKRRPGDVDDTRAPVGGIRIGHCCQVVSGDVLNMEHVAKLFAPGPQGEQPRWAAEPKLDGWRMQVHIAKHKHDDTGKEPEVFMFVPRHKKDHTQITYAKADIIPALIESSKVDELIVDGEMVVWDKDQQRCGGFHFHKPVANGEMEGLQIAYYAFDLLHVKNEGQVYHVLDQPLYKRREHLKRVLREVPNRVMLTPHKEVFTKDEITQEYNRHIDADEEGMMLKNLNGPYLRGQRKNSGWFKLKPDYGGDTMDLLVVGGFLGETSGRRNHSSSELVDHITHFLVAVRKKTEEGEDKAESLNHVIPITKIGTGFTMEELRSARNHVRNHVIQYKRPSDAPWFPPDWRPSAKVKPHLVWPPSKGWVMEVVCAEIVDADDFPFSHDGIRKTLRHPRVPFRKGASAFMRDDKQPIDAEDEDSIAKWLSGDPFTRNNRIRVRRAGGDDENGGGGSSDEGEGAPERKKAKKSHHRRDGPLQRGIIDSQKPIDVSHVVPISDLFKNEQFHFLGEDEEFSRAVLTVRVVELGADKMVPVHYKPLTTTRVIAPKETYNTRCFHRRWQKEVIRPQWIIDCMEQNRKLDLHPRYLVHSSPELDEKWADLMDQYGDLYYEDVTPEGLAKLMDSMPTPPPDSEAAKTAEYLMERYPNLMRTKQMPYVGMRVYIDQPNYLREYIGSTPRPRPSAAPAASASASASAAGGARPAAPRQAPAASRHDLKAGCDELDRMTEEMERGLVALKMSQRGARIVDTQGMATHIVTTDNGVCKVVEVRSGGVLEMEESDDDDIPYDNPLDVMEEDT